MTVIPPRATTTGPHFINQCLREGIIKKIEKKVGKFQLGWGGVWGGHFPTFFFFVFLASKWSKTSRNAKKFFFNFSTPPPLSPPAPWLWTVVPPLQVGNWWIGGNILSFFNFSRGKIQIYSKYVNKSIADKKSKKNFFFQLSWEGGGQIPKVGNFQLFFRFF